MRTLRSGRTCSSTASTQRGSRGLNTPRLVRLKHSRHTATTPWMWGLSHTLCLNSTGWTLLVFFFFFLKSATLWRWAMKERNLCPEESTYMHKYTITISNYKRLPKSLQASTKVLRHISHPALDISYAHENPANVTPCIWIGKLRN